ncbi:MAG TPA: ThiF family adenylyltransferase [Actinomycetes bacterium]|nr:ThiF family adenylyltransferase [Actinomycetes bacterium]
MRPMFRPGLSCAWRSDNCLHLDVDNPNPILLGSLPSQAAAALDLMDGTRTLDELIATLQQSGPVSGVRDMVRRLVDLGAVIDCRVWPGGRKVATDSRNRLLPDLTASGPRDPDEWWERLAQTHVVVIGASRLGSLIASTLATAGVGRVTVDDRRKITEGDLVHGGFTSSDVGRRRCELFILHPELQAMKRTNRPFSRRLYVVTDCVDADLRGSALMRQGSAHLVVRSSGRTGRVGPFVVPGQTACLFCVHLHHRDHDPAWPMVWRQVQWDATPVTHSITVGITANTAASHVLAWMNGDEPASMRGLVDVDGTLGTPQFRSTPVHPECGCGWAETAAS